MPHRPQHAGERLLVDVAVHRQPDPIGQVDVDAARSCPECRRTKSSVVAAGGNGLAGAAAGIVGASAKPGSTATASVTTPYGMNCNGSVAIGCASRRVLRQPWMRLADMPSRRDTPTTGGPGSSHCASTAARSSSEYRRRRSTPVMTSMRLIRTLLTEYERSLLRADRLAQLRHAGNTSDRTRTAAQQPSQDVLNKLTSIAHVKGKLRGRGFAPCRPRILPSPRCKTIMITAAPISLVV